MAEPTSHDLAAILEETPVVVFAIDTTGKVRVSAGGGLNAVGFATNQLVGSNIFEMYPDRADLGSDCRRALAGEEFQVVREIDGRTFEIQYRPTHDEAGVRNGAQGISVDITARVEGEVALRRLTEVDGVTHLRSRTAAETAITDVLAAGRPITVLLVDLDEFKDINDSHGHATGDEVLRRIGSRLAGLAPTGSVLGRLGGDELVIGIPTTDTDTVAKVCEDILAAVAEPMRIEVGTGPGRDNLDVTVTASIGVAVAPTDGTTTSALLTRADSAMYAAKRAGRATYRHYRPEADQAGRRLVVSSRLRRAIAGGDLRVEFQPVVALGTGEIASFEALARWTDPQLGPVGPDEFIHVAEKSPMIDDLFDVVLEQALAAAVQWNARAITAGGTIRRVYGGTLIGVHVNIAARQLRDPSLAERIVAAASRAGCPTNIILIELTETAMMDDTATAFDVLVAMKEAGIGVVIDDYGVGYSNMARLGDLAAAHLLEAVKIDRSFVARLPTDWARTLLRMFLTMTESLGVRAIVEGVETEDQMNVVRHLGYRYGQGWLFGRAMPADAAAQLIERGNRSYAGFVES